MINKTILGGILVISLVSIILASSYTGAFFSDTETSAGNTFSAGTLNLQVGNTDPVTWNLDENVMPGDSDGETVDVENTGTLDGFLHINFTNLLNNDVTCTEPELLEESDCNSDNIGELAENLFITVYFDNDNSTDFSNGDTLIYRGMVNNTTTSILQAKLVDSELLAGNKENFRIDWEIDGVVENEVQSDSVQFDIPFELTQNPKTVMDGLVGYWTLNEKGNTAYDLSGNNNDGTIHGATLTNGVSGGALSFDGNGDYVDCGSDSSLNITDEITIEAWVKLNGWPPANDYANIVGKTGGSGGNNDFSYMIYVVESSHSIRPHVRESDGNIIWFDSTSINLNTWYHIVQVADGNNLRLYINGVEDSNSLKPYDGTIKSIDGNVYIAHDTREEYFNGTIDEIRIYNRALTLAEIQQNFEAGR